MESNTKPVCIVPVLPSSNIAKDISWYNKKAGFPGKKIIHEHFNPTLVTY